MSRIDINRVNLLFECEDCGTKQQVTPLDVVLCGVPLCRDCNEEMAVDDGVTIID